MPYKLKSSARRSRRNKRIGIVAGLVLLAAIVIGLILVFGQPPVQYSLLVEVKGSGSTNATGTQMHNAGSVVIVKATASPDWVLSEWLLNGASVGVSANPYTLTVSDNVNFTAVFTELPHSDKVLLQTSMGDITIELRDDKPNTSGNFKKLVQEGIYDGTIFHRVIAGFMIQGGDPTGTGTGDPSIASIPDEIGTDNRNVNGTIAMAMPMGRRDSASSQFFINVVDNSQPDFDSDYTVFGKVIAGMDVAEAISKVATDDADKPLTDVTLIKATILP